MNKSKKIIGITIIAVLFLVAVQIVLPMLTSNFIGTDDQSTEIIQLIQPDYEPWFNQLSLFNGDMAETLLFALQALIGLSVIAFYIIKKQTNKLKTKQ